jgi:cbb3-type cytochrome oxidase subunit 3
MTEKPVLDYGGFQKQPTAKNLLAVALLIMAVFGAPATITAMILCNQVYIISLCSIAVLWFVFRSGRRLGQNKTARIARLVTLLWAPLFLCCAFLLELRDIFCGP